VRQPVRLDLAGDHAVAAGIPQAQPPGSAADRVDPDMLTALAAALTGAIPSDSQYPTEPGRWPMLAPARTRNVQATRDLRRATAGPRYPGLPVAIMAG
jgi:hypothetical protein